jgi:hypothetical protein
MDEIRLTRDQLKEITGRKRPKEIIEWLRAGAFVFRLDGNGWPIVHPAHYAEKMGVKTSAKEAREAREKAESSRKFEEALAQMSVEAERREQLMAEKRRLKAEREAAFAEQKRLRAEERQRRREDKQRQTAERKLKSKNGPPVLPQPE